MNILVLLFDAFSAKNIPFYGYPRNTTPHISRLLDKAIVYHNHYAASNFTSPGTASLLTGQHVWTHRAFSLRDKVINNYVNDNIFSHFPDYYRIAYTQNAFANVFLTQFLSNIQRFQEPETLFINKHWLSDLTKQDLDIAKLAMLRIFEQPNYFGTSLLFKSFSPQINQFVEKRRSAKKIIKKLRSNFPNGLPTAKEIDKTYDKFVLEWATNWVIDQLTNCPQPFLSYIHLLPPHNPYNSRSDFVGAFENDNNLPLLKPTHYLTLDKDINRQDYYTPILQDYDEFIQYVDSEFNRLIELLKTNNILDNTIVILTSDHGEIFERGFQLHNCYSLHQPLVKIPLVIFHPNNHSRVDIHDITSAVDILPTLHKITNSTPQSGLVGQVLQPYSTNTHNNVSFALHASGIRQNRRIRRGTVMMVQEQYKLIHHFGYEQLSGHGPITEFYNIEKDAEELENLYTQNDPIAKKMLSNLLNKIEEADKYY